MALDPPLFDDQTPLGLVGEFFCLRRANVSAVFESAEAGRRASAEGVLVVTTVRLCFVGRGLAFDLPLQSVSREAFRQPIFGANYLEGTCAPVPGRGLVNAVSFRLTFPAGGCGTFLRVFFQLMEQHRLAQELAARAQAQALAAPAPAAPSFFAPERASAWVAEQQAFVDPTDPSTLFLAQPVFPPRVRQSFEPVRAGDSGSAVRSPRELEAREGDTLLGGGGGGGGDSRAAGAPQPQSSYYAVGDAAAAHQQMLQQQQQQQQQQQPLYHGAPPPIAVRHEPAPASSGGGGIMSTMLRFFVR